MEASMASLEKEAEVGLARELLAGNLGAFDRFVEGFRSRLFQYTLLVCGHREDAEEVAQDTLLKVFESFEQLREPEHVRAWVFRIARNACLMKRRKSVFAPPQELSLDELMPAMNQSGGERRLEIVDRSSLPDAQVLAGELRQALEDAIGSLPLIYKTVLLLRDVEELSTEETAQILDTSPDVVKTRLHRARLAVRQKLDGVYHRFEPATAPAPLNFEAREKLLAACQHVLGARRSAPQI
jgi:RNA polymerase sigma-70 factor (ECF subfamily)